ncbi:hypothetical protein, partial [Chromohalobacter sp. HP20-39]|uniref:hypothetical protein n=1 Tax=Chromohalobacter sp. HP20-39 TaxID=3079306 RepID=UPI00294B5646
GAREPNGILNAGTRIWGGENNDCRISELNDLSNSRERWTFNRSVFVQMGIDEKYLGTRYLMGRNDPGSGKEWRQGRRI